MVELVLKDHTIGHKSIVSQDKWSLMTGSISLKCGTFCQEYLVRRLKTGSLMEVVSQLTRQVSQYIVHVECVCRVLCI